MPQAYLLKCYTFYTETHQLQKVAELDFYVVFHFPKTALSKQKITDNLFREGCGERQAVTH